MKGAEIWTLLKIFQKFLSSFEIWCSRRMKNKVLRKIKEEKNILHII
jgi:uncharacterized protein YjbK